MTVTMDQQLIAVIDALCAKFGMAIDWTSVNVMPELQRLFGKYINWEFVTSIIFLIAGIAGLALGIWIVARVMVTRRFPEEALLIAALFIALGCGVICMETFDVVTCITFPEKFILDYFKTVMQSG